MYFLSPEFACIIYKKDNLKKESHCQFIIEVEKQKRKGKRKENIESRTLKLLISRPPEKNKKVSEEHQYIECSVVKKIFWKQIFCYSKIIWPKDTCPGKQTFSISIVYFS